MNLHKYSWRSIGVFVTLFAIVPGESFAMRGHGRPAGVNEAMWEFARMAGDIADDVARTNREKQRQHEHQEQAWTTEINRLKERGVPDNDPRILDIQRQREKMDRNDRLEEQAANIGIGLFGQLGNAVIGDYTKERDIEKAQREALAKGFMDNKGARERLNVIIDQAKDPVFLAKIAVFAAGVTLGVVGVYYAVKLVSRYIEMKMGKPTLVRESSINGFRQAVKKFIVSLFKNEQGSEDILNDIIMSPDIQENLHTLAEDTRQTNEFGLPYQNVLFYGPPGTGKTEFAKILSRYSGMDYAILSGADFRQFKDGEGITELHNLFDWAAKSKKGLIIFIDEADACFRDRATLDKDGVSFVNAFLSHTGTNSDKFMIVLATNYEDELDAAVRSRIHKKIPFMLPALEERFKIFELKLKKYVFDDKRSYYKESVWVNEHLTVDDSLNDEFWMSISKRTEGFSGRDIDQAVSEMRLRAYRSGLNVLTKEIAEKVIDDKIAQIAKDKTSTAYQRRKFEQTYNIKDNNDYVLDSRKGNPARLVPLNAA